MFITMVGAKSKYKIFLLRWDEWVTTDRLMTYTEENVQKHLAINKKQGIHKSTELARSSNFKEKSTNVLASGKKRKSDDRRFMENINITMEMCAKIQIPLGLRKHLVDDCEFITCMGKLPRLPRHPNVSEIFQWYIQHRTEQKEPSADSVHEIMKGLQCYFDKALPLRLLYSEERQQYERAMAAYDLTPSHVYGAEHLLRLFVLMPELLYHANMEEEALVELIENFNDFLKYLRMNQGACFRSDCYIADAADDTDSSTDKPEDIV
ncbi:protein MRG1 isoform X2 [Cannabis sativa]|uniref:protein MRG1 isoform X2 n=1 Tax=Cannabis sativa TaxID=3483 RepID=UPI0011DF8838|nr:protein MRG1 isoform X2 [Cannabis sativa]